MCIRDRKEGADIHYEDNVALIGEAFKSPDDTLVVYTPAVPESHTELTYFRAHGFEVMKRARVLGEITKSSRGLCVAGTHGKTTTSSMLAHLLKQSPVDCNAFLGGILKNYESNLDVYKRQRQDRAEFFHGGDQLFDLLGSYAGVDKRYVAGSRGERDR